MGFRNSKNSRQIRSNSTIKFNKKWNIRLAHKKNTESLMKEKRKLINFNNNKPNTGISQDFSTDIKNNNVTSVENIDSRQKK